MLRDHAEALVVNSRRCVAQPLLEIFGLKKEVLGKECRAVGTKLQGVRTVIRIPRMHGSHRAFPARQLADQTGLLSTGAQSRLYRAVGLQGP
jgi:hypothetical protein